MVITEGVDSADRMIVSGGCHCGAVTYRYFSPVAQPDIQIRSCDCTFCTKHGARYTSHPEGRLEVELAMSGSLS